MKLVGSQQRGLKREAPILTIRVFSQTYSLIFFSSGKWKEEEEKERQGKRARGGMTYDLLIVVNL